MLRFGELLTSTKKDRTELSLQEISPTPIFRKFYPIGKFQKWAAYVDKYLLFPKRLKRYILDQKDPVYLIHIIDHSNSIY